MSASNPNRKKLWITIAVVAIVAIVIGSVFAYTRSPSTAPAAPSGPNITIWNGSFCSTSSNCGYSPTAKNVTTGTTVTWTNNGNPHTVTTCDPNHYNSAGCPSQDATSLEAFDSGTISNGQSYPHTFNSAGTYYYYCTLHAWMQGKIIVR